LAAEELRNAMAEAEDEIRSMNYLFAEIHTDMSAFGIMRVFDGLR
jgi:hypothetical protein